MNSPGSIYLDFNATCPVASCVKENIFGWLNEFHGNPSSPHLEGKASKEALEVARDSVSQLIFCNPKNLIFTSGASESIQTVFHHFLHHKPESRKVALSRTEHMATISAARFYQSMGTQILWVEVDPHGQLDLGSLKKVLLQRPDFISVCPANNETGALVDLKSLSLFCSEHNIPLHLDATQWVGKIPWPKNLFNERQPDFISISGHKFGSLKGIGALVVNARGPITPLVEGGGQEFGLRGGTPALIPAISMGTVAREIKQSLDEEYGRMLFLKKQLESLLLQQFPGCLIHSQKVDRLPNTTCIYLPNKDAQSLVNFLSRKKIAISSGSACSTGKLEPSHVLSAMKVTSEKIASTIRVSLGRTTSISDIETFLSAIKNFPS